MRAFIAAPLISCLGPSAWHLDLAFRKTVAALSVGGSVLYVHPLQTKPWWIPLSLTVVVSLKKKKKGKKMEVVKLNLAPFIQVVSKSFGTRWIWFVKRT